MEAHTKLTPSQLPCAAGAALPGQAATVRESKLLLFLDRLRILLIFGVLLGSPERCQRSGRCLGVSRSRHQSAHRTNLMILNGILMACGMGLFFAQADYFTPSSFDLKGALPHENLLPSAFPTHFSAVLR
jgi:hypothetical protein